MRARHHEVTRRHPSHLESDLIKITHDTCFQKTRQHLHGRSYSPPVWLLKMVTHLHCSTLASLLLDPNTVLGPMNLFNNRNTTYSFWSLPVGACLCGINKRKMMNSARMYENVSWCVSTKRWRHTERVGFTYAARFHTITSLSSPPDAKYKPLFDQRTQFTHAETLHKTSD